VPDDGIAGEDRTHRATVDGRVRVTYSTAAGSCELRLPCL
jgi:hypothetical protein